VTVGTIETTTEETTEEGVAIALMCLPTNAPSMKAPRMKHQVSSQTR